MDSLLESSDILRHILPYVGEFQYRFVAAVSRRFQENYTHMFPGETRTYRNVSTVGHAKICFEERHFETIYHQYCLFCCAAKYGNLLTVQYLYSVQCACDDRICEYAAERGHLDVLQWAKENGIPWDESKCLNDSVCNGHLHILQWARANGCPWADKTCQYAAQNGHLHVLQWARENGCPWDESTCSYAARNGHLHVLHWARANGSPWDRWTCIFAAENGHLQVLQWARENGCPWDVSTCSYAAEHGHLNVLQWARANGCPWDKWTCLFAAENGHLQVLQWARENGCPWDTTQVLIRARRHAGNIEWINYNCSE